MNTLGYKINDPNESDTTDTDSLKADDREYPSDEESKHGYTFIQKKRTRKRRVKRELLEKEDYVSE